MVLAGASAYGLSMTGSFYRANARWLAVGVTLTLASSFGQTFFISLFAGEIRMAYGLSDGGWGGIYTAATLASAAMLVLAGRFADEIPVARLATLILTGFAAISVGMALNDSPLVLVALIFGLRFCGQGMISHLGITAMGRWFRAHRGRAVAIAGLGYALGEAVFPAVAAALVPLIGWRNVWLGVALVLVVAILPLARWLASNERHPKGQAEDHQSPGRDGRHWTRRAVLGTWLFWALVPATIAASLIGTVVFFQMVHIAGIMGWERVAMTGAYPLYAALAIGAALPAGWAADRFGPDRLLPVYLLPMGAGVLLIGPFEGVWAWYAALALVGITTGLGNAMWGALLPELFGTRHLGAIKALAAAFMVVGSAIGPGITGLAIDLGVPFTGQVLWMTGGVVAISGLHLAVVARLPARPAPQSA